MVTHTLLQKTLLQIVCFQLFPHSPNRVRISLKKGNINTLVFTLMRTLFLHFLWFVCFMQKVPGVYAPLV
jgi:hypothetical protein